MGKSTKQLRICSSAKQLEAAMDTDSDDDQLPPFKEILGSNFGTLSVGSHSYRSWGFAKP
jgi:hypothetical protein